MVPELNQPIQQLFPRLLRNLNDKNRTSTSTDALRNKAEQSKNAFTWSNGICTGNGGHDLPLISIVIVIAIVGLLLWLVNNYIPMQGTIKGILNGVVVIALII
jgi:hypothetical protein